MPLEPSARRNLVSVLRGDIQALERLSDLAERFGGRLEPTVRDSGEVWAAAMTLHHLYNALEHSCERIARVCDQWVADQARWHRELLNQMFVEIPNVRPAVFPQTLRPTLEELLAFRHFVRHAYEVALDPRQITLVVTAWQGQRGEVREAIEAFITFLESPVPVSDD